MHIRTKNIFGRIVSANGLELGAHIALQPIKTPTNKTELKRLIRMIP